jgi:pyruvate dehydrogenase E1 component alpha subunit
VYSSAGEAIERARRGEGPTLLEYKTYRFMGHSRGDPGGYRSKEEIQFWREHDPLLLFRGKLIAEYGQDEGTLDAVGAEVSEAIDQAIEFAQGSPDPEPDEVLEHVYSGEVSEP